MNAGVTIKILLFYKNLFVLVLWLKKNTESGKKLRMRILALYFFFIIKIRRCQLKVRKYVFIKMDKFELRLRMTNKNITQLL